MHGTLKVDALNAWYDRAQALFEVSLEVGPGEVLALIGRNGAGKSTLLKSICGIVRTRSGAVHWGPTNLLPLLPFEVARLGIGYVPEDRRIFTALTVRENLMLGAQGAARSESVGHSALPPWTIERVIELFPNLAQMLERRASDMSGGEQQMLTIARTLMGNPQLLLLDEPSEGVAPIIVQQLGAAIAVLKQIGLSVLVSEQNLALVHQVADRVCGLERGQVVFMGTLDAWKADAGQRNRLLGA